MRTLAHISDIHFGREDPEIVAGLLEAIATARPDVIVVSGDLTQRAKKRQFRAARAFLRDLPQVPLIVVPGNHDVSATNLFERAVRPLARYKRFISRDLSPFHADAEVAIAGINTVRVGAVKNGRINLRQMKLVCEQFEGAGQDAGQGTPQGPAQTSARIVVMHHPIDMPEHDVEHALVGRSAAAMKEFARCRVDLFLSGHVHSGITISTAARYRLGGYSAVLAQAGTAASTRRRGQVNAWNLIRISGAPTGSSSPEQSPEKTIDIQQMTWDPDSKKGGAFKPARTERYVKSAEGWQLQRS